MTTGCCFFCTGVIVLSSYKTCSRATKSITGDGGSAQTTKRMIGFVLPVNFLPLCKG